MKRILVYKVSGQPVKRGDVVKTFRGEDATVDGWVEPHKPDSTGRVLLRIEPYQPHAYFPSVINAEWREEGIA